MPKQPKIHPQPFKHSLRLKRPCENCPFLKEGAISLRPGRVEGIVNELLEDDQKTFHCHKVVHHPKLGGEWNEAGAYEPSGNEAMCAGAAALLIKRGRPTVGMRIAFALGQADPHQWDEVLSKVID
jgi:hypothetical protein